MVLLLLTIKLRMNNEKSPHYTGDERCFQENTDDPGFLIESGSA